MRMSTLYVYICIYIYICGVTCIYIYLYTYIHTCIQMHMCFHIPVRANRYMRQKSGTSFPEDEDPA